MRRAQTAVEFMILVAFVLFFFVAFLFSLGLSSSYRLYERQALELHEVARTIQQEVALAHATVDGYNRTFSLPSSIVNLPYVIEVVEGYLYVHTTNEKHALSLPVANVTGSFVPGENRIRKTDTVVYVNG